MNLSWYSNESIGYENWYHNSLPHGLLDCRNVKSIKSKWKLFIFQWSLTHVSKCFFERIWLIIYKKFQCDRFNVLILWSIEILKRNIICTLNISFLSLIETLSIHVWWNAFINNDPSQVLLVLVKYFILLNNCS